MSIEHKPTQNERVLDYIERFGGITHLDAERDLGVMRLASRISDLKRMGYPITSKFVSVKNRFGEKCHIKRYMMKETALYEEMCIGCPDEKKCHDDCVVCDEMLEAMEGGDE